MTKYHRVETDILVPKKEYEKLLKAACFCKSNPKPKGEKQKKQKKQKKGASTLAEKATDLLRSQLNIPKEAGLGPRGSSSSSSSNETAKKPRKPKVKKDVVMTDLDTPKRGIKRKPEHVMPRIMKKFSGSRPLKRPRSPLEDDHLLLLQQGWKRLRQAGKEFQRSVPVNRKIDLDEDNETNPMKRSRLLL